MTMQNLTRLSMIMLASALLLGACGTSPDPAFYTLSPTPGTANTGITDTINVGRPVIPAFLDRPDFVSQDGASRLRINETANWVAPLDEMVESVLANDLRQRLPKSTVQTDADDETRVPRFIVETDLRQLNLVSDRTKLAGTLTLTDHAVKQQPAPIAIDLASDESSNDPASTAAALNDLIGQYSDRIAAQLAAQPAIPEK